MLSSTNGPMDEKTAKNAFITKALSISNLYLFTQKGDFSTTTNSTSLFSKFVEFGKQEGLFSPPKKASRR